MSDKSRGCPKCPGAMEFRLGVFVCPHCGHSEPATPPKEEQKSSGPGFRSEKQWGGAIVKPENPDVIPTRPTEGGLYSLGADSQIGKKEPSGIRFTKFLQTEKHIFFALSVTGSLLKLFWGGFQHNPADAVLGPTWSTICIGAWLLALAFALFGSDIFAKYGCMGWAGLSLVGTVSSVFYINTWFGQFTAPGLAGGGPQAGVWIIILACFGAAWQVWLIWILYRDSQRLS